MTDSHIKNSKYLINFMHEWVRLTTNIGLVLVIFYGTDLVTTLDYAVQELRKGSSVPNKKFSVKIQVAP